MKERLFKEPATTKLLKLAAAILYTLAASIFISVFVTNYLDEERKENHRKQLENIQSAINKDVFEALFLQLMPREIFAVLKEEVIGSKGVRREATWSMEFSEHQESIILRETVQYELHNLTTQEFQNPITTTTYDADSETTLLRAELKVDNTVLSAYDHRCPEKAVGVEITGVPPERNLKFTRSIPPLKFARVTLVFRVRYGRDVAKDCYFTRFPLINGRLEASFPPGYSFELFQSFSSPLECILDDGNRKIYEMKGALLPHQGYQFILKKLPGHQSLEGESS